MHAPGVGVASKCWQCWHVGYAVLIAVPLLGILSILTILGVFQKSLSNSLHSQQAPKTLARCGLQRGQRDAKSTPIRDRH